jgi:nucleoside-diphosphate-sugar epimerase
LSQTIATMNESSTNTESEAITLASYKGKTVLVTGGAGFIGSRLVNALSQVSCRVVLLLRPGRTWESLGETESEIVTLSGDILDKQTWIKALASTDYVFHFAAQTSAYVANADPQADLDANVTPLVRMLDACRADGVKPTIMFAGTATQAGLQNETQVNETAQDLPVTAYDINKLAGEKHLQRYTGETGVPTVTLRLANVYGPGTNVGSGDRGFLNLMVKNALNKAPLTVYGDGHNIRDYIFIDDVVSAFLAAGHSASGVSGNYYVIGSGQGTSIVDAVNLVSDRAETRLGSRPEVKHIPAPEGLSPIEDRDFVADSRLFSSTTGWAPKVSLEHGIDRTIEYLMSKSS